MSIQNPEYREWFFTEEGLPLLPFDPVDTPTEQDNPIPSKTKVVNGEIIGTIFKEDNEPTEVNYLKLSRSAIFKLNAADRAKDETNPDFTSPNTGDVYGGHVTLATNNQAILRDNGNENLFSRVPRVSQLTEVGNSDSTVINNFAIDLIPDSPISPLSVERDITIITHSDYDVELNDDFWNWQLQTLDAVKTYVDTVDVTPGVVTVNPGGAGLSVITDPVTGTDTHRFTINLDIPVDNDPGLTANSDNQIPSQRAVRSYVDGVVLGVGGKADQVDLDALTTRVLLMEGATPEEKVNLSDFVALSTIVGNKLSSINDDTAAGVITFTQVPNTPVLPVNPNDIANKNYIDTTLLNYYTQAEVDALLAIERLRLDALEAQVADIYSQLAAIPNDYYNRIQVDALLDDKSDITHTHDGVYHPFVVGSTGIEQLKRISQITLKDGIVTNIVT